MDKIGLKMGKFGLKMGKIGLKNYPGYPECFILDNYLGLYPDIQDKIIQDRNSSLHICFSTTQWARRTMLCIGARPIVDLRQKIPHRSGMHMALCSFP